MKNLAKILIALTVFLSGVALVPVMGLPTQGFRWQAYANAYNLPALSINHPMGSPGSVLTVSGINFTPDSTVSVSINGIELGTLQTDSMGGLIFLLDTTGAENGYYVVTVSGVANTAVAFNLNDAEPVWPQEDEAPLFFVPANAAAQPIFLPSVHR